MSQHTPGPWKWVGDLKHNARIIHDNADKRLGRSTICDVTMGSAADAALIAAAPELLAACEKAFAMFQQSPLNHDGDWIRSELATRLRAAIAKASGKAVQP